MLDYKVTITHVRDACPFDRKRKNASYCKVCKAHNDPCTGIGVETVISTKKIGQDKMKQILNVIK